MGSQAITISAVLDPVPLSVARGRREVDRLFANTDQSPDGSRERVWLVVSELVSNAVIHGSNEPIGLELTRDLRSVRVCVRHDGAGMNTKNPGRERDESGRGLAIVAAVSESCTIDSSPAGTTVTAHVLLEPL